MNAPARQARALSAARHWCIGGRVQGVGFRPFVYRLALRYGLGGWVRNRGGLVEIVAQGAPRQLERFGASLLRMHPPAAQPRLLSVAPAAPEACASFEIRPSAPENATTAHVPPDLFACDECLAELHDPHSRRYRYPFINCTQCGPRYTLIRALPYDRPNTSMASFTLCRHCSAEYHDVRDRRFHAQPLACPSCGPQLRWQPVRGDVEQLGEQALGACLEALARGQIVAVRGIGGYHLLCDAANEEAVTELRRRKHRPTKPLALMAPWRGNDGLEAVRSIARLHAADAHALLDPTRPIVLVSRRADAVLAPAVAPHLSEIGVMLPYSPLHHLLLEAFAAPLVATSGNISGEPVLTEVDEAQQRLAAVTDGFLHHDRPIVRPADDPVVRTVAGRSRPVRLGRGTAPLELTLPQPQAEPTLAVGAYLKNTVALGWGDRAVISPHIGALGSVRAQQIFERVARDLQALYGVQAQLLVHDRHPGFANSRWAQRQGLRTRAVWHHHAHAAALAGERCVHGPMLCFTWDGVGLGPDGTLWGGEALLGIAGRWIRVASLAPFRLPGGELAARSPWRSALGLCWSNGVPWSEVEDRIDPLLRQAFERGINAPLSSAAGRLFDAAAALIGACREVSFEAEAPMRLEALARSVPASDAPALQLPLVCDADGVWRTQAVPLIAALLDTQRAPALRARCFHETLVAALCSQAERVRAEHGIQLVGLCGGVFQNRLLSEAAIERLSALGFEVLLPERLPANDAAISFGQLVEAAAEAPH